MCIFLLLLTTVLINHPYQIFPYQVAMNTIVGASRTFGLANIDPLKDNHTVEVWSTPGGKYTDMIDLIQNHTILHHGGPIEEDQTHIYVAAGVCDITTKLSNPKKHYCEVVFKTEASTSIDNTKSRILDLQRHIIKLGHTPIFCTIVPTHLETLNFHYLNKNKTSYLSHSSKYQEMQDEAMTVFNSINTFIPDINSKLGMTTPFLHRSVMHNTKKSKHYFQYKKLPHRCHASPELKMKWAIELDHAIQINRK